VSSKVKLPRAPSPFPVVILGIDPGQSSGFAISEAGKIRIAGTCSHDDGLTMAGIVAEAHAMAADAGIPCVIVAEKWSAGGWLSTDTLLGLGASWGAWRSVLLDARVPKKRIVRVLPQTWRAGLGLKRARDGDDVESWKATTRRFVSEACGLNLEHDASDAVGIALWGACAPGTVLALGKREAAKVASPAYLAALYAALDAKRKESK
jgi:hypothetical protein